jgi:pimeloyl-ACP methyl ester carboxylesterase
MQSPNNKKSCKINGNAIAYYRVGKRKNQTVLLVHGLSTYSFIWRNIVPTMSQTYDVIAVDLLGCGDSDKPLDVEYSLTEHVEILKKFIKKLRVKKIHYVGHDVGGGIGQIMAIKYPDLLYDLTLINTVAYDSWPIKPAITMYIPFIRKLAVTSKLRSIVKRALFFKQRCTPELMQFFLRPMETKEGRQAFLHFSRCHANRNLAEFSEDLRKVNLPVFIIRGEADVYLSVEIAKRLQREIPGSILLRIGTGGYFIQEDEPEKLSDEIVNFFQGNGHSY